MTPLAVAVAGAAVRYIHLRRRTFEAEFYRRQLSHRAGPAFVFNWAEHKRLKKEALGG